MSNEQLRLIDLLDDMSSGKDVFFRLVCHVEDVMTKNVKTLALDDTVETSLKFIKENQVRHIPVIDSPTGEEGKPYFVGIVSERDVVRQISPYVGKIGELDSDSKALKQPVTQIITRNPKSIPLNATITDAITTMLDNRIDMLPVLSGQELVGIITTTDILKLFVRLNAVCQLCRKTEKKEQRKRFVDLLSGNSEKAMVGLSTMLQTVEDIMTEQVVTLEGQETLAKAIETMQKGNFRHVPVIEKQKKLVGIVSDRDILQHLPFRSRQLKLETSVFRDRLFDIALNDPATQQKIHKVMKRDMTHVLPSCDFYTAVEMLYDMKISCLPVADEEKNLLGIITVTDVMRGLLAAYRLFDKTNS